MNVIWISLKESMSCGCKMSDVARLPEYMPRRRSNSSSSSSDTKLNNIENMADYEESPFMQPRFRHYNNIRNRFHELELGDPSRNVVEMIFRASSTNPTRPSRKIKRVLKVNNPLDILAKFEKYRETVMTSSYEHQPNRHPRSVVDGNEVLQFYGTTMSCCSKNTSQVSQLCRNPSCRVCRIIQSGFNTCYNKKYGIQLSMKSEQMSEDKTVFTKGNKKGKKAVIICRTIAGSVLDTEGEQEEDESVENGLCTKPDEFLTLRNPTAVLPCFVIVFG